jgi:hypothetical protein
MLQGVITCGICGGPMYQRPISTKRKDASKHTVLYYRCKGPDKAPSTCRNMVRAELVDTYVDGWFSGDGAFAGVDLAETVVEQGNDYAVEIADIDSRLDALDRNADDYEDLHASLMAERKQLRAMATSETTITKRLTGQTVGEMWAELTDAGKRAYLTAAKFRVKVRPLTDGDAGGLNGKHIEFNSEFDPSQAIVALQGA